MVRLNAPAPDIALEGVVGGRVRGFRLSEFRGRWVVLFFYWDWAPRTSRSRSGPAS